MNKARNYKVTIFGDRYSLITDESESHVAKAALLVDSLMQQVAKKIKNADNKKVAVLVALQLASNNLSLAQVSEQENTHALELIDLIDHTVSSILYEQK